MEQIARRAVIVAVALCIVVGGVLFYFGSTGEASYEAEWEQEYAKMDSQALSACVATASANEIDACYESHGPHTGRLQRATDAAARARQSKFEGIWIGAVLPAAILFAFVVLRWIATGRWRGRSRSVRATYIPKDSA
jgi:hypothetical protein